MTRSGKKKRKMYTGRTQKYRYSLKLAVSSMHVLTLQNGVLACLSALGDAMSRAVNVTRVATRR